MAPLNNLQHIAVLDCGTDIIVFLSHQSKGKQTVQTGNQVGVDLNGRSIFGQGKDQIIEEFQLQRENLVFGSQNLFLVFFQFLSDVTLGIDQSLFSDPTLWYFVLMSISYLKVISVDVVVTYLQTGDSGFFGFALLDLQQIVFAFVSNMAQFIELGIYSFGNDPTLIDQQRRIGLDFASNTVADGSTQIELFANTFQSRVLGLLAGGLYRFNGLKRRAQLHHITGRHSSHGNLGDNTLQITDQMELFFDNLSVFQILKEVFHHIQTLVDGFFILQRKKKPTFEQTRSHRSNRTVNDIQQGVAAFVHRTQ